MENTCYDAPEAQIRARIYDKGKISFAEFMELALYYPKGGYYSSPSAFGTGGDYFTSPAAHPAFGALLAVQLCRMWELLGCPSRFYAVEPGAGSGLLARDICESAASIRPPFARSLQYVTLERYLFPMSTSSPWRLVSDGVPLRGIVGCFISNELLDAFPVHRFQVRDGKLQEVFVTLDGQGNFAETLGQPSTPQIARRLGSAVAALAEGACGEVSPGVGPWMKAVSEALHRGFVLTIDYGYKARGLNAAPGAGGTLQTYYRHSPAGSPYQRIGRQDITAHVDFSAVASAGEQAGLRSLGLRTQAEFLRDLGFERILAQLRAKALGRRELQANVMGMRQLVQPGGLGSFKVLVQERDTGVKDLDQLAPTGAWSEGMEVPLLRPDHMPLMEGRYPHLAWQPEAFLPRRGEMEQA